MSSLTYALITPAKNEARFLERTIQSIIAQTHRPTRWVIVDDDSSDATSQIARTFAEQYDFITLVSRRNTATRRTFASKVHAFNAGLLELKGTQYELIGNLDADMTLPPDYYGNMAAAFERDPRLGLAGGPIFYPVGEQYETNDMTPDSVGGAVQLFRRECFQQIDGYIPLECGGIDAAAEITARMSGWSVRKIPDNPVFEERRTGSTQHGVLRGRFKEGVQAQRLGYHMGFYLLRCIYRANERPIVAGSLLSLLGFLSSRQRREPICLRPDVVRYLRAEQKRKLMRVLAPKRATAPLICPHPRLSRTDAAHPLRDADASFAHVTLSPVQDTVPDTLMTKP
jgi:glycosyltransferase involved in cell wall biosynthesis